MKRSFFAAIGVMLGLSLVMTGLSGGSHAQSNAMLASLGFPELRVVVSADGVEAPAEIEAGVYLLSVENHADSLAQVSTLQLPEGMVLEDLLEAEHDWYYDAVLAGGVGAEPGATAQALIELTPGEWFLDVWREEFESDDEESREPPINLTVTDTPPATTLPELPESFEIILDDHSFEIPELVAGPQVWKVANAGTQPHVLSLTRGPDGVTLEQVLQISDAMMTGEDLPAGLPNPETDFHDVMSIAAISAGKSMWIELDLEPGSYVMVCWISDRDTGTPHQDLGMIEVVAVD
jgi:hypothetical protein